jgi:hypothetical protein
MLIVSFRCLLRLIFRGPETIDTPWGKMSIRFSWRGMKKVSVPTGDPANPVAKVTPGYAGGGCWVKVDEPLE